MRGPLETGQFIFSYNRKRLHPKQLQLMSKVNLDKLIYLDDDSMRISPSDGWTVVYPADEEKLVANYIAENPYPDYQSMWSSLPMELAAEYGTVNHCLIKQVYENMHFQQVLREAGDQIHTRGGMQALHANFTVLKYYSPMAKHVLTRSYCGRVENAWDGIGIWKP